MATQPESVDELLLEQIIDGLKFRGQFVRHCDETDTDEVARIRSLGRRAGHNLGWKIITFASDPDRREDRKIVVVVAVEESNPLHEELMRIRGEKTIRKMSHKREA
ncbi:hypothetical protein [Psychromicrobium sp. YIM B11713]|uniref:hypothetical protein n=1 Tax=Psychromicrobium sp. YIM B11713 TaxID=3145233 RepID=UPI00374EBE86